MNSLIITAIGLTLLVGGLATKNVPILIASTMAWIFFGFMMYSGTYANSAMNISLLTFGGAMALLCGFVALNQLMSARKSDDLDDPDAEEVEHKRLIDRLTHRDEKW